MHRWVVGDTEIVRIDASNFVLPTPDPVPGWTVPTFTPGVDQTPLAFTALAIRSGDRQIVVDPWIVDDSPRLRPDATQIVDGLLADLAAAGFAAADVDTVVNTHIDGIGWNTRPSSDGSGGWEPTFPNARYLIPAAELAAIDAGANIAGGDQIGPLREAGVVEPIDPSMLPYAVTPEVSLHDAPGHNAGHHLVRIESQGSIAIYPGHLVISLGQVDDPSKNDVDSDPAVATATRRQIFGELADRRGLLLTTLIGGPGGGTVARHGAGFRLRSAHVDG